MTIELYSIGSVCRQLQQGMGQVLRTVQSLGIEPHTRIDGIAHYTDEQVNRIRQGVNGTAPRAGHRLIGTTAAHETRQDEGGARVH